MSVFKRVTLALSTTLDRMVGEIENHDAVVEAGIRESRRLYAKARVRHTRLQQEGERLRRALDSARVDEQQWRERALGCADTPEGEERALLCLERSRRAAQQVCALTETCQRHLDTETELGRELDGLRRRVEELEHRRQLMRSREATADAALHIRDSDRDALIGLDDTFERWEIRLTEAELTTDSLAGSEHLDPLASEFAAAEAREALRAELDALKRARATGGL